MDLLNRYTKLLSIILALISTPRGPIWASGTAEACSLIFADTDISKFSAVTPRDYTLNGSFTLQGGPKLNELNDARRWARDRLIEGHLNLNEALAPNAPEHVVYNWASLEKNLTNMTRGFQKKDVIRLLEKKNYAHYGLYAMSDPVSASHFGVVLMEIAVYKDHYPLRDSDGNIRWHPIKDWQFSFDPSADAGAGVNIFISKTDTFKTASYLIQDLRIIKQIRFPNKEVILGTWFDLNFRSTDPSTGPLTQLAEQWLITPNYTITEKTAVLNQAPQQFIEYLNTRSETSWNLGSNVTTPMGSNTSRRFDGVLKVLFKTDLELVDHNTLQTKYELLTERWKRLSPQDKLHLESIRDSLLDSRVKRLLSFITSIGKSSFVREKTALIEYLKVSDSKNRNFAFYKKTTLQGDLRRLEAIQNQ